MKPVGLTSTRPDSKTLRHRAAAQDNKLGTLYNIVRLPTKLKHGAQQRVFDHSRLRAADSRASAGCTAHFLNSPKLLTASCGCASSRGCARGQMTGCEGYVESASTA